MRRSNAILLTTLFALVLVSSVGANERVPEDHWLQYVDPAEAGFDPELLAAAKVRWEELPSSAFFVVADGAVVAAWGDVERRFMCHSVRKSFLSALYGIYWDRGEIELNKTLSDLGIDDEPDPLLESEKQARTLDLLKARSGVFHPAAYAGRTDSRPRGSEGPGRYFAYNNWDFNTLVTILEQETGVKVFEAFDEHLGQPLGLEDWRISDAYYHYELDKSKHPAYPFRMSARDAARIGLLFTREGRWGENQLLSRSWVRRSTALYSIDNDVFGYGFMWWVAREPRFSRHGMVCALGVGNQMIAALPDSDLVIVNRANTYEGENTPAGDLLDLIEQVLAARTGTPAASPELLPLDEQAPNPAITEVDGDQLAEYAGSWSFPAPQLGLPVQTTFELTVGQGHLIGNSSRTGTFAVYLQPDGSLVREDAWEALLPIRDKAGTYVGISDESSVVQGAALAAGSGELPRAREIMAIVVDQSSSQVKVGRAVIDLLDNHVDTAELALQQLAEQSSPRSVESTVNWFGYVLMGSDLKEAANTVFELNTRLFPDAYNTWDSLAEAQMGLGNTDTAIRFYQRSLELNSNNRNATAMIARLQAKDAEPAGLDYQALMKEARVPGLALALIDGGTVVETKLLGVADAETSAPVTEETMFEAASLSKTVFATIVLRLAERGEIDLDRPLLEDLAYERVSHDPRARAITARMVLSHRTGLPNWGPERLELGSYPGTLFRYSGEGFVFLQKVVEKITGLPLDELARREVFEPLGMKHSRFSWSEGEELPLAMPHDETGRQQQKNQRFKGNAAASLHTTAGDFARFVVAWMGGEIVSPATARQALAPVVGMANVKRQHWRPWEIRNRIAWGLGWAIQLPEDGQESEPITWHWGDNGAFKAFVAFRPKAGSGVVYFANGTNGLAIGREIVAEHLDDMRPAFAWTGTVPHDAPGFAERLQAMEAEEDGRFDEAIEAYQASLEADPSQEVTKSRIAWLRELIEVAESPVEVDEALLQRYAGTYGPRTITFREGKLFYQRQGRSEYPLTPLSESLFALEGLTSFRLELVCDSAGNPTHVVGVYVDGSRDESPRDVPEEP